MEKKKKGFFFCLLISPDILLKKRRGHRNPQGKGITIKRRLESLGLRKETGNLEPKMGPLTIIPTGEEVYTIAGASGEQPKLSTLSEQEGRDLRSLNYTTIVCREMRVRRGGLTFCIV